MPSHLKIRARLLLTAATAALIVVAMPGSLALAGVSGAQAPPGRSSTGLQPLAVTASDWTTFDHDSLRSGVDPSGNSFSPATPAWTSPTLDGQLYGQPLVFAGTVFAATENDTVYALAADSGKVLWSHHLATPVEAAALPCGDISPTVGITSTPIIDASRSEIFVVADEASSPIAAHHLIGLDLYTGAILLDKVIDPPNTDPAAQLQRASLALDDGSVIAGFGGNAGDCSDYHGLVVSAPEDGSTPTTYVVADLPGDSQGAVWMGGAAPTVDAQGNVWVATGNSAFHSSSDTYDESDGVLEISPAMKLVQAFTPKAWYADNASDLDLGSSAPALLPNGLAFEVGKSQTAYVLAQSHLGGVNGQVALTNSFCFADGGSADLDGTLFVPCSGGIEAVTPTASPPERAVVHFHWGARLPDCRRWPGVVDRQWQPLRVGPRKRHRGPALRYRTFGVVISFALGSRRAYPGTVLHPDPRLRGPGRLAAAHHKCADSRHRCDAVGHSHLGRLRLERHQRGVPALRRHLRLCGPGAVHSHTDPLRMVVQLELHDGTQRLLCPRV